ncbi:uncharacterized protein LY89DRAFT_731650 [Mollisia scopiformis]|uniref:Uncharacterized protein n=1 Tax=Mollisia scopiformis TaxID=149040 RepID=A0A194XGC0_MOLSC|nr:uncharacterized protein LY89DRAFT_731650 [Mollisia scopiformis]KUJ19240.1 hypothetical protein LY89DRAFT_731650 [Mollisia scopiformis]
MGIRRLRYSDEGIRVWPVRCRHTFAVVLVTAFATAGHTHAVELWYRTQASKPAHDGVQPTESDETVNRGLSPRKLEGSLQTFGDWQMGTSCVTADALKF